MEEFLKKLWEGFERLPKMGKYIISGVSVLVILLLMSGGFGSNNDINNNNYGNQGNGNTQNSNNYSSNKYYEENYYYQEAKEKPFKENFTKKKNGYFVVPNDWKLKWKPYLTIYENFVDLPTEKGYFLLNSPTLEDKHDFSSKKTVRVSGYIRTSNGVFYMTKYSYDNRNKEGFPKFIYQIK